MLIISSGMQKSGTAYFYNVLNDLLKLSGANDARLIKEKYSLENVLKEINNNADGISVKDLLKLILICKRTGSFAIKTHYANRISFRLLSKTGFVKIIYSYRDPRDVILSVIEHGKKLIESGERGNFTNMVNLEDALRNTQNWVKDWEVFSKQKNIFVYKFENFLSDPKGIIIEVFKFIEIKVKIEHIEDVLSYYDPANPHMPKGRLHFNKGLSGRFKTDMTASEQKKVIELIGKEIRDMGYDI